MEQARQVRLNDVRVSEWRNAVRHEFDGAPDSALFDQDVTAVVLGTNTTVLSFWRMQGKGPNFVRVGKSAKYRKADILQFVAENSRDKRDE